jgi:hypothetical protein
VVVDLCGSSEFTTRYPFSSDGGAAAVLTGQRRPLLASSLVGGLCQAKNLEAVLLGALLDVDRVTVMW